MMTSSNYQIADSDELEALGRDDDPNYDTSAGLGPGDDVGMAEAASSSSKRRWCVCLVFVVLTLAGLVTFLSVFFGGGGRSEKKKASSDGNSSSNEPSTPAKSPAAVPSGHISPSIQPSPSSVATFTVTVIDKTPHDEQAFIQGLEYQDGFFYEGTGLRGRSTLRKVEIGSGKVLQNYKFDNDSLFGEGITLHKNEHIFMLTWQSGRGLIFNQSTFEVIKEWKYEGEGWGLTMDRSSEEVYMSDGTSALRVLDPQDMSEKRRIDVTLRGKHVTNLNELEWICGEVWANVWQSRQIYRIDPKTGLVKSIINAEALPEKEDITPSMDVLNGIAFDKDTGRLWLTGKLWKTVYQVSISDSSLNLKECK